MNNRLLYFSIHLHDKDGDKDTGRASTSSNDFYPGTGEKDDVAHNIYNVPMVPLWKAGAEHMWGSK